MELNPYILLLIALLSPILLYCSTLNHNIWSRGKNSPPSPPKLPIIGNLHQLGSLPHRSLHSLAQKYGPVMLLHFGSVPVLIVSSPDWATEVMKTHDLVFANRPPYKAFKKLAYDCKDIVSSPYGEHWKKMKSIFVLHLVSNKKVHTSRSVREEETALFVGEIERSVHSCDQPVNLSEMFARFAYDGVCRSAFGKKYSETENGKKFMLLLSDLTRLLGGIEIGDFIPWLGWIGRVNGSDKRLDRVAEEIDQVFESVIQECIKGDTFIGTLLQIYSDSIDRDSIKSLIMDAFFAGTDTTFTTLEWVMTELLLYPTVMRKLQSEVREIVKQKEYIRDDDLEKMHYLKAVIKEALRYHPPAPLLVPRISNEDVQIKGFDFLAGTMVIINAWAIGRDPIYWDEPEKFMPERFLNSSRDFRGTDFAYIPFGAGRRKCPGITFAMEAVELLLANLVQKFDWKLPDGVEVKDLDMNEIYGVTVHKVLPLLAVASQCK